MRPRVLAVLAAAVVGAACSNQADFTASPNIPLVGTWSNTHAIFVSSESGATLQIPCITIEFPTIVLDDTLAFTIVGSVASATGLVTVKPGDAWVQSGHSVGTTLVLNSAGAGADTLAVGGGTEPLVCNE